MIVEQKHKSHMQSLCCCCATEAHIGFCFLLKSSCWWALCCGLPVGILTINNNNAFWYVFCVFQCGPSWDPRMFKNHPWLKPWKLRCVGVVWAIKLKLSVLQNQRRQNQLPLSGDHSDQLGASNKPVTSETDRSPQNWFWDQWDYFFSFCHQWCNRHVVLLNALDKVIELNMVTHRSDGYI